MPTHYFDHAATTPLDADVLAAMMPFLTTFYGNASSPHAMGQASHSALDRARDDVAAVLGCSVSEVVFTAGGSEGDNLAVKGVAFAYQQTHGSAHVVVSAIEHHAVLHAAEALTRHGIAVTVLPVDADGMVQVDAIAAAIRPDTALVSVMYANNEIGTIQPIAHIAAVCRARGVLCHTDAVQAAGLLDLNVQHLGVDMLSMTAHKCYGPKGVGAMYVKRGTPLWPQIHGGSHERQRRAGTENVAGIVGLATALTLADTKRDAEVARLTPLRDQLMAQIGALPGVRVTGHSSQRLANNASFVIDGVDGDSLLILLDQRGICASSGSACTSGSLEPSHVLTAIGAIGTDVQAALRLTLGRSTQPDDVVWVATQVAEVLQIVRHA
ncbi:MAG: cysteine desulfurase family protein [Roseiflexaceae bacterium]